MTRTARRKVAITGMLGNALEWYDYALYGHMSLAFSKLFFPNDDPSFNLILTYLIFAVGFVFRPLGAVVFGRIGDKYGRKRALSASMILMAIPTGMIALLPTYEMIGYAAPILLVLIRILQGLSLGGAFSGSMSYVVEHAPMDARATQGSFTMLGLVTGFLFGSIVSTLVSSSMSEAQFMEWGWRLPFLVGVCIGFLGIWVKNHGTESPVYEEAKTSGGLSKSPLRDVFLKYPLKMFEGFSAYLCVTIPFYTLAIYMIAYTKAHLGLAQEQALQINSLAMVAMLLPIYPMARLSDRIGRKKVLFFAIAGLVFTAYPAFLAMQSGDFLTVMAAQMLLAFFAGCYLAPIPALLVEIFPTSIRYTGMSLSYNFSAILGGFTPSFAQFFIEKTGDKTSIMYLIIVAGLASFSSLLFYKDRWREALD